MKIRIAIQTVENNKYKHIHNIMLETENIERIIKKTRKALHKEIKKREELLQQWIESRMPDMYDKIIQETDEDLIDWKSKGSDISKKEFLQNEMEFELRGE